MSARKFVVFTWLLLLLTINYGNSQNSFDHYKELIESKTSSDYSVQVEQLVDNLLKIDSVNSAIRIAHHYSLRLYFEGKYDLGLYFVLKEKKIYEDQHIFNKKYINIIFNAGLFSFNNLEFEKARIFFEEVLEKDHFNYKVKSSYFELGRTYDRLGKYQESINYYKKRNLIFEDEKDYVGLIAGLINISIPYSKMENVQYSKKALRFLKKADSLSKIFPVSISRYLNLQNSLAFKYTNRANFDFDNARKYNMNCLRSGLKNKDSAVIGLAYSNLSYLYNIARKDSVPYFVEMALRYIKDDPEVEARTYDNLADHQIFNKNLDDAKKSIHNSLEIITKSNFEELPNHSQIDQAILKDYILYCLKKKAEIYLLLFQRDNSKNDLTTALGNVALAEYIVSSLLNGTSEQSNQMIWRRQASQAYLYGAYASHLLDDAEQAFSFMEKNKALLLSESVLKNTEFANLPRNVSEQETSFQKQIYELENKLSKNENNTELQDSLFNAKRIHEKYVDSLKTIYPKYFARKINVDQISLTEVQQELDEKEAVLSYIWNDFDRDTELIIGLITTRDQAKTFEVKNTKEIRQKLKSYRKLISEPFATKEDGASFQKISYQLYASLLPSEELRAMVKNKNLTIIPDGDLQNIPFESLITEENSDQYLILNGDVSYSYSYSFLKHNEKVSRKTEGTFIGYSPNTFETLSLANLPNTQQEIQDINVELEGIIKLQNDASKEDFLKSSSNAKIIHLATHADVGNNPWIAFSDEKLELHELYTYRNNADLVTLSACNTSLGELAKGEGVLSLARGFFYSGSKSVVSSLWEVNDKATSEIMTNFYKNLKNGETKSEAINNAKRTYLSKYTLSEQSPYYWSSFVLIGDAGTIDISSNMSIYLGVTVVIMILLLFVLRLKKTKKQVQ